MTIDRLRRFFDAWNDHDVETIVSYFTPDGAYFASIGPDAEGTAFRGTAEVRRGVAAFLGTYGDVHYTDLVMGMDGDRGFASWTFSATRPDGEQVATGASTSSPSRATSSPSRTPTARSAHGPSADSPVTHEYVIGLGGNDRPAPVRLRRDDVHSHRVGRRPGAGRGMDDVVRSSRAGISRSWTFTAVS